MAISIAVESPLSDEVRALMRALNDVLNALSPPEFIFFEKSIAAGSAVSA